MKYPTDRDGKSKTASAVDADHYPEQHEVDAEETFPGPLHDDIAARAHQLWMRRGAGHGSADRDWFEAEEELRAAKNSKDARGAQTESGSVQR